MKLELCVTDKLGLVLSKKYSFDRIELCSNLELGGTTPSNGLVLQALQEKIETHVLIRPRAGDFYYDDGEKETILAEIHALSDLPVTGFVVGGLKPNQEIDTTLMGEIRKLTKHKELTFHRAFDEMKNWEDGVEVLKFFQFKRVLTSGLASNVDLGIENFNRIQNVFGNHLEMMIGGGVNAENIGRLSKEIQPSAIHFSAAIKSNLKNSRFAINRLKIDEHRLQDILMNAK